MKKIFLFSLVLSLICINANAKKYLTITAISSGNAAILSGQIPEGMQSFYYGAQYNKDGYESTTIYWIGELLNELAQKGYIVEQMTAGQDNADLHITYLLSCDDSPHNMQSISKQTTDNSKVTEVARYNLQGKPVSAEEKGLQVIVFSNYTTKTVIVE